MLRIGVVGLGYWGPNLVRNICSSERWKLTAVADGNPERLNSISKVAPFARQASDLDSILPDVDAIVIATPPETHQELVQAALTAGKHVLVEKPLTHDQDASWDLVSFARRNNLVLAVDHTFLYTGSVEYLKRAIDGGELGTLYGLDSVRVNLGLYQRHASVCADLASHDIAIFNYLLGEHPESVAAVSLQLLTGSDSDVAYVTLRYPSGIHAHIHVSWLSPVKIRRMTIAGSKRMALWDDVEPSEKVRIYDKGADYAGVDGRASSFVSYRAGDTHLPALDSREALGKVVNAFHEAISDGVAMKCSGSEGAAVVDVLAAIEASVASNGAFVPVLTGQKESSRA